MDHFDPRLSAANIAPTTLTQLCAFASERGIPFEPWFLRAHVRPEQLDTAEARVSYRQATTIIRHAVRALPEEAIGIAVGSRNSAVGFGILGFALRSSRTVGEAAALAGEMHGLTGILTDYELTRHDDLVAVQILQRFPDPELVCFLTEYAIAAALSFCRSILDDEIRPVVARLNYSEPTYSAEYRRFLGCRVEFDCEVSELRYPTEVFRRTIPTHSEASLSVALDACRRMIGDDDTRHDVVASVEAILSEALRRSVSMSEVADRMLLPERTLRRHLRAAGESFSDIRDRVRQRRALYLVRETSMTIAQIAAETGYSDAREFRRAYVRWNGEPPSRTRRAAELPETAADESEQVAW